MGVEVPDVTPSVSLPPALGTKNFQPTVPPALPELPAVVKPGEYHPGYCAHIIAYFDKPKKREVWDTFTYKSGAESEKVRYVPNPPPMFSEYARSIGVSTRTLKKWGREHPEFQEALETCQEIFEEFIIENGLTGEYGAIAMKFVAVNKTRMRDKSEQTTKTVDMNKVLDQIAAGGIRPGGELLGDGSESNEETGYVSI